MILRLTENSINSEDPIQDLVEENELNIKFFFIEDTETSFDVTAQLFSIHWDVVLGESIGKEDRSCQGFVTIDDVREMFQVDAVNVIIGPFSFFIIDYAILQQTKRFVGPQTDETFD
jgi:hypothetical protein